MPFIPNEADAFNAEQAKFDSEHFSPLLAGYLGNGVLSGCTISEDPITPDMTVDVSSGVIQWEGQRVTVSGQLNNTVAAADGTNPRIDWVSVSSTGTVAVTTGTPAASPAFPALPANSVALGYIFVPANDTAITDAQIIDSRVLVHQRGYGAYFMAASNASAYEQGVANEVLDGTDDDVQINAALVAHKRVAASSGVFDVGAPIEIGSLNHLSGSGMGTVFQANGITTGDRAVFVSKGNTAILWTLSDLAIDGNYAAGGPCHGIRMRGTGLDAIDPPAPGADAWFTIRNIFIEGTRDATTTYKGIWLESANGTLRSGFLENIGIREVGGAGLHVDGSSDNVISNVHVGSSRQYGFLIEGANNRWTNVKSFYADVAGFRVNSSRNTFSAVEAQDMIGVGFDCQGDNTVVTGLHIGAENVRACTSGLVVAANGCSFTGVLWRIGSGSMDQAVNWVSGSRNEVRGTIHNVEADFDTAYFLGTPHISDVVHIALNGQPAYRSGTEKITEVSAATTLDPTQSVVNVDTSGGSVAITLPDNATYNGKGFLVRRDGASAVTITRAGTDTFDDAATSKSLDTDGAAIGFFSVGDGEWKIVSTEGTVT